MLLPESKLPSKLDTTLMVTLSGSLCKPVPFVTTHSNATSLCKRTSSVVNVGVTEVGSLNVTNGLKV